MDISLNEKTMGVGPLKGQKVFIASLVCQKEHIPFDRLCALMAEDSTVGESDVAAVFYKARKVLNFLCAQGYIVDAGPLGTFRPSIQSKVVKKAEDFKVSEHIKRAQMRFVPTRDFRELKGVEYHKVPKQERKKKS